MTFILVTPAEKALQVACTLAERFHKHTNKQYTLSVGIVLAPIKYPFSLQRQLVDDTLKAAKMAGAKSKADEEQSRINFVVVTGNTSLSYAHIYNQLHAEFGQRPTLLGRIFGSSLYPGTIRFDDARLQRRLLQEGYKRMQTSVSTQVRYRSCYTDCRRRGSLHQRAWHA